LCGGSSPGARALDFRGSSADIVNHDPNHAGHQAMTDTPAGATNAMGQPADEADAPGAGDTAVDSGGAAADPAAALAREAAEARDRWMRALAEMENLRRRTEREVADARTYGIANFARDILAVADNMDRALKALDDELREKADAAVKGLLDGVELTERELHKVLEKHGVKRLEPAGEKFDPNFHQAMFEVPDPSVPAGTVVQVVQAGYMIADRVLRPALVGIAKGGTKAGAGTEPARASETAANDNADGGN
jgi:molecular chaperone GrpE